MTTVNLPSWVIKFLEGNDDLFAIDDSHVTEISASESVPIIHSLIHSPPGVAVARGLRGEGAQRLIDAIGQTIALPELDEKLRKQCLHLLYKLCKDCRMLPSSYNLQQGSLHLGVVHCYGGFADVSKGKYFEHHVAVKHLRFGTRDGSKRIFKRFCREIIAWKCLSHPNILPLLGVSFSMDPYSFRMVSCWMKNGNIVEYAGSNPGANRLQLLCGVMAGANYLHKLGVIHGDFKGANILVDDDGIPVIADFGLATISVDLNTIPLSATAVSSVGTVCWTSPEVLLGKDSPPTQESDCYALGMVVYEVLTGRRPFYHLGQYAVVIAILHGERPRKPLNAGSLGFSERLWRLVVRCWDKSPSARPTAQDLLRCLQDAPPIWEPPLEYPIPDDPDGEAEPGSLSRSEVVMATGALTSGFFALLVAVACVFMLSFK